MTYQLETFGHFLSEIWLISPEDARKSIGFWMMLFDQKILENYQSSLNLLLKSWMTNGRNILIQSLDDWQTQAGPIQAIIFQMYMPVAQKKMLLDLVKNWMTEQELTSEIFSSYQSTEITSIQPTTVPFLTDNASAGSTNSRKRKGTFADAYAARAKPRLSDMKIGTMWSSISQPMNTSVQPLRSIVRTDDYIVKIVITQAKNIAGKDANVHYKYADSTVTVTIPANSIILKDLDKVNQKCLEYLLATIEKSEESRERY
jgi:hypothetical protein